MSETIFNAEESAKIQKVLDVASKNEAEVRQINKRLAELRSEFRQAYNASGVQEMFIEKEENDSDDYVYETDEFSKLTEEAQRVGLGLSWEGYDLWMPSTQSC